MKKLISLFMAAMLLCGVATNSFAAEEDFNLIDYVETQKSIRIQSF